VGLLELRQEQPTIMVVEEELPVAKTRNLPEGAARSTHLPMKAVQESGELFPGSWLFTCAGSVEEDLQPPGRNLLQDSEPGSPGLQGSGQGTGGTVEPFR
jgi:hypothetical protein